MRILWADKPSTYSSLNLGGVGPNFPDPHGDIIGSTDDIFKPSRSRFVRFESLPGDSGDSWIVAEAPTGLNVDAAAAVAIVRFPFVGGLTEAEQVDYEIGLVGLAGSGLLAAVVGVDIAMSGAGPAVTTSVDVGGGFGTASITNFFGDFFPGWMALAVDFDPDMVTLDGLKCTAKCTTEASDYLVDFGFIGFMRQWRYKNLEISSTFQVDLRDPSIIQISDGGQLYATNIDKRRSISFDIRPVDEDDAIVTSTPETSGLLTLVDALGTTVPAFWIPDEDNPDAPFAKSKNIFGTVREWPPIIYAQNNDWSMSGIVVDELL